MDVSKEDTDVIIRLSILSLLLLVALAVGCTKTNDTASQNANSVENTTNPGPDNSEIATKVDANGVKTEERTFHGNPRIARVVVTTHGGTRTAKAYSPSGQERDLNQNEAEKALDATGDKVADAAGFVADKSEDVAGGAKDVGVAAKDKTEAVGEKTVDASKKVGEKTVDTAKTVGDKTVEGAKTVGDKTVEGAKTVGNKTVSGAKKATNAVKKVIP
jgi:hypothetical protein